VETLLGAADQGLYRAKSNGRNRTESVVRSSPKVA
jgi:PleD family two-component response regulator